MRRSLTAVLSRRGFHTHTWIRFTRWQDAVAEKKLFEGYDDKAKVITDRSGGIADGVYASIDDPSEVVRKPYEDRTREEVGGEKFDTMAWRTEWRYLDITPESQRRYQRYQNFLVAQYDQRFLAERHLTLGPDLAAAHFLLARHASVKFLGDPKWYKADRFGRFTLPGQRVAGLHIEAIDASGTRLRYEGLENLMDLNHCRMLSLADCEFIGDWCIDRLAAQFGESLELLDLSRCPRLTAQGITGLAPLKGLRQVRVGGREAVSQYCPLAEAKAAMALEAAIPGLVVYGIDYEGAGVEAERQKLLGSHASVVEDARGSRWLYDDEGEFHLLHSGAMRERPVVDDDELPLLVSTAVKDPPALPMEDLETLDHLSQGRLRHGLVGSPSGLDRAEDTRLLLEHGVRKAAAFKQPVHPFLHPPPLQPSTPAPAIPSSENLTALPQQSSSSQSSQSKD